MEKQSKNYYNMSKIKMKENGVSKVWIVWRNWYTQVGGVRVFHAANDIHENMNVEDIEDIEEDEFEWLDEITTTAELRKAVEWGSEEEM